MSEIFSQLNVFCDKPSDVLLFNHIKKYSEELSKIPNNQVDVLPTLQQLQSVAPTTLCSLLEGDRADYYICYQNEPLIIIEMTEHGYTGDMCLQRFARIMRSAELHIPFIYFSPISRSRYDELDQINPSLRNVNSDMFRGFVRLSEIYDTPVISMEWKTSANGLPMILGVDDPKVTGIQELLDLLSNLIPNHFHALYRHESILNAPELKNSIENTKKLSLNNNVRPSDVRHEHLPFDKIISIIKNPIEAFTLLDREEYFFKGKIHKLLGLMSIENSNINHVIMPDNSVMTIDNFVLEYQDVLSKKNWLYYYSGYQWRSEPNVGIVTNIDIVACREAKGQTLKDRSQLLCVHWPRIFWNRNSKTRLHLLSSLQDNISDPYLNDLVCEKVKYSDKIPSPELLISNDKAFGTWSNSTTVARIYRNVCDIIILNDVVIVGNNWRNI